MRLLALMMSGFPVSPAAAQGQAMIYPPTAADKPVVATPAALPPSVAATPAPPLTDKDKRQMDAEVKEGTNFDKEFAKEAKISKDADLIARVDRVGQKVAAQANLWQIKAGFGNNKVFPFVWHFRVVDDSDINAFSVPGGYVYINSGLLKMVASDDELAGVLGHEITHSAHHHVMKLEHEQSIMQIGSIAAALLAIYGSAQSDRSNQYSVGQAVDPYNPNSTNDTITNNGAAAVGTALPLIEQKILSNDLGEAAERDADHGGVVYMQKAGYNPLGMLTFMEKLEDLEHRSVSTALGLGTIFQDHPYTDERVIAIRAELAAMGIKENDSDLARISTPAVVFYASVVNPTTRSIAFGNTICATLHDPDGSRMAKLLPPLNAAMSAGLQQYQVSSFENVVMVQSKPWLEVEPDDVGANTGATAASIASSIVHQIQLVIYKRSFPAVPSSTGMKG